MSLVHYFLLLSGAALVVVGIILFARLQRSDVAAVKLPSPVNVEISVPSALLIFVAGIVFVAIGIIPAFESPGEPSGISARIDPFPNGETLLFGPCPNAVSLTGTIRVDQGVGDVYYSFVYLGNNGTWRGQRLKRYFAEPGERKVEESLRIKSSTSGVFYVDVTSPENTQSDQTPISYQCTS